MKKKKSTKGTAQTKTKKTKSKKTAAAGTARTNAQMTAKGVKSLRSTRAKKRTAKPAGGTKSAKKTNGLAKSMDKMKNRAPLKSTSESRAKNGKNGLKTWSTGEERASTKPSMGKVAISDEQTAPLEERLAPRTDKAYSPTDAFSANAQGSQNMKSGGGPRKPIRQSRNQVGARHH